MVFCPKCGLENKDDARFCTNCGAELMKINNTMVCPYCQATINSGSRKCQYCGEWIQKDRIHSVDYSIYSGYILIFLSVILTMITATTSFLVVTPIAILACSVAFVLLMNGLFVYTNKKAYSKRPIIFMVLGVIFLLLNLIILFDALTYY